MDPPRSEGLGEEGLMGLTVARQHGRVCNIRKVC